MQAVRRPWTIRPPRPLGDRLRAEAYQPGNLVSHTVLLQGPFVERSHPAQMSDGRDCLFPGACTRHTGDVEPAYLSPEMPCWTPRTEAALRDAVQQGLLEESHYVDVKREISAGRSSNKELARDLASFAVDGGTLIIGVGEDKDANSLYLASQPLSGLAERIEMVARTVPDPPLAVLCSPIRSDQDESLGYLIVRIPPSAMAPHMVEHKYLGRGDKTKLYLSDPEVRRLHEQRRATEQDGLARLKEQFDRDPIPPEVRKQAHLFLLAEPSAARPGMLLDLVHGPAVQVKLSEFARRADAHNICETLEPTGGFSPSLTWASDFAFRSAGAALTYGMANDRSWSSGDGPSPEDAVELEVDEDGGLRIFMSRLSDSLQSADPARSGERLLVAGAVVYARQFVALTASAAEHAGYLGTWILAAGATGIGSLPVHDHLLRGRTGPRQDASTYRRATTASYAELVKQPGTVTERLIGRLLRATGTYELYREALANPPDPVQEPA